MKITFELMDEQNVRILKGNEEIGQIITPSGSNNDHINAIQVCGFSEAFDLWSCGAYKGFKDIQLLFDNKQLGGEFHFEMVKGCLRCYRNPCQCETLPLKTKIDPYAFKFSDIPFTVKLSTDEKFRNRIKIKGDEKKEAFDLEWLKKKLKQPIYELMKEYPELNHLICTTKTNNVEKEIAIDFLINKFKSSQKK